MEELEAVGNPMIFESNLEEISRFWDQKTFEEWSWKALGAQFGSKRQPDKARRELEGANVVPRKQKRPPERCQDARKNPNLEALAPIFERKCDPNGCNEGKKQEK